MMMMIFYSDFRAVALLEIRGPIQRLQNTVIGPGFPAIELPRSVRSNLSKFFVRVACGRSSVLLW